MSRAHPRLTILAALLFLTWPSGALAESPQRSIVTTHAVERGYSYEFTDDDLLGGGTAAYGTVIGSGTRFPRVLLIRPRTQFVAEMLKSVESL